MTMVPLFAATIFVVPLRLPKQAQTRLERSEQCDKSGFGSSSGAVGEKQ